MSGVRVAREAVVPPRSLALQGGEVHGAPAHLRVTVGAEGVEVIDVDAEKAAKAAGCAW